MVCRIFYFNLLRVYREFYLLSGKKFKRSSIAKAVLNRFDKIYNIFEKEGFKDIKIIKDLAGLDRVVLGRL